jgi:hypothetical protein
VEVIQLILDYSALSDRAESRARCEELAEDNGSDNGLQYKLSTPLLQKQCFHTAAIKQNER